MFYKSILPFRYFIYTRLLSQVTRISHFVFYVIPIIYLFFAFSEMHDLQSILIFFIAYLLVNYTYETGYIQNDTQTVKLEKTATYRLEKDEQEFIDKHFKIIIGIRSLIFLCLFFLIVYFAGNVFNTYLFVLLIFTLGVVFFVYNRIRSNLNFYLIFILTYLKSFTAVLPFIQSSVLEIAVALAFLQPIPKLIEFTREEKYRDVLIPRLCLPVDVFRVAYFSVLTIALWILSDVSEILQQLLILSVYLMVFRSIGYVLSKISQRIAIDINKNTKKSFRS